MRSIVTVHWEYPEGRNGITTTHKKRFEVFKDLGINHKFIYLGEILASGTYKTILDLGLIEDSVYPIMDYFDINLKEPTISIEEMLNILNLSILDSEKEGSKLIFSNYVLHLYNEYVYRVDDLVNYRLSLYTDKLVYTMTIKNLDHRYIEVYGNNGLVLLSCNLYNDNSYYSFEDQNNVSEEVFYNLFWEKYYKKNIFEFIIRDKSNLYIPSCKYKIYQYIHFSNFDKFINKVENINNVVAYISTVYRYKVKDKKTYYIPVSWSENKENKYFVDNKLKLTTVCSLYWAKGIPDLVKAIKLMRNDNIDITLDIWGEGEEKYFSEGIYYKGVSDSLNDMFSGYTAFISGSITEFFGTAILEAMSYGLPIIARNIDYAPRDYVIDGHNGYLYDDINGIVDSIKKIKNLQCNELLNMSRNSKCRSAIYNYNIVKNSWISFFEDIKKI